MDINALRVLTRVRAIMDVGEDATDAADATAFCTTVASTRNAKLQYSLLRELLLLLLLQLHAAHWLQQQ